MVDKRRMDDLREEIGMQFSLTGRLVRSQMMWAGLLMRMEAGRLPKRVEAVKEGELERRHFPELFNRPGKVATPKTRKTGVGRKHIPHGYGDDLEFIPHGRHVREEHEERCGPDWVSSIRRIPSPHNPKAIVELWPDKWKAIRTYPNVKGRRTDQGWVPYSDKVGVGAHRCVFDGAHKATDHSSQEITHTMLYGKGRRGIDQRGGLPYASCGDKSYQAPEYSANFHELGSTLPLFSFGGRPKHKPETTVQLEEIASTGEPYIVKERRRKMEEAVSDVEALEKWRPATPLVNPLKV
ncbi:hypothetical protein LSAT2_001753 [Lamellibrachia satsuma]|nr:hypothetical protein LSAT2_001753 [Lamellibrachia satsuma]